MSANEGMLKITNTLSGRKEPWSPQVAGEAKLYVCGITAYDHCHLGHARSAIVFDVIRNHLEAKGLSVRYVKNFTDVDDKIIHRARQEGKDWREIAETYIGSYERDMARLGVRPPTVAPKATEHIPEMIRIVEGLIAKGVAYPIDGSVYFEVAKFPAYGKLSKQKLDEMMAGARVEVDERKKSPLDFALWKASKPGEPAWESPWGKGRPGWHIECSAMAIRHLGGRFDLHGGGKDLIFPHHENEIAQSEAYTGEEFVRAWIHHGFVTVDQEKMSKSLGNFFTIKEIFEKSSHFPEAVVSEVIRFYLLSTHYRSPVDFSDQSLKGAKSGLDNFYTLFQKLDEISSRREEDAGAGSDREGDEGWERFRAAFDAAMDDDFNTARAIGVLQELRAEVNARVGKEEAGAARRAQRLFDSFGKALGLFRVPPKGWSFRPWESAAGEATLSDGAIQTLIREREAARKQKDWKKSDELRERLAAAGIVIEDRPDGTTRIKR
ncbi:MAG TPA: cysteine--tRNA ligase [Candidatus Manganitrophaceae bacterium]|nr:cysteine--tRNA ligase [Candidatus Manganitrophaceae bacterium]